MPGCSPAELPTRMNDVTPTRASSSTAIAVDGQPMPVEVAVMRRPLYIPHIVRCSRLWATSRTSVRNSAISGTRNGSPGNSATVPTSPGSDPDVELPCTDTRFALVDDHGGESTTLSLPGRGSRPGEIRL